MTWTGVPIGCRLQGKSSDDSAVEGEDQNGKNIKRETPEHTARGQGASSSANKSTDFGAKGKEKVLHTPITVPQTEGQSEHGVSRGATDHKTPQVQGQHSAERTEWAMGNDPPSRTAIASSSNAGPGVVAGEQSTRNPPGGRSATDYEGISSAVRIRGSVLELTGRVQKRPIRVLTVALPVISFRIQSRQLWFYEWCQMHNTRN